MVDDELEQSFDIETGVYRDPDTGEFHEGDPPHDYDPSVDRFRAHDGQFKDRAQDLGEGEPFDAPAEDAANTPQDARNTDEMDDVDDFADSLFDDL